MWGGVARLEDGPKSQRVCESDEKGWGDAGFDPIGVPAPLWHRSTPMIGSRLPPRSPGVPRNPPAPRRSAPDTDARLLAVPIHSFGGSPGLYGKKEEREGGGLSSRRIFIPWEGGDGQWRFKTPPRRGCPAPSHRSLTISLQQRGIYTGSWENSISVPFFNTA